MESFLSALNPSVREDVRAAVREVPNGHQRLEMVVSGFFDDEGNWPTDPSTADLLARRFVHEVETIRTPTINSSFGPSGLTGATVAGLAGGAVALGAGRGAVVLSSGLVNGYWTEMLGYATGIQPQVIRRTVGVINRVGREFNWTRIGPELVQNPVAEAWDTLFGNRYERMLKNELTGVFARSAWRGARSALYNTDSKTVGDVAQVNPWLDAYVSRLASNQRQLSGRTAMSVLNRGLSEGQTPAMMSRRLRELWALSPRNAAAVDRYRDTLRRGGMRAPKANELAGSYADRLMRQRISTMAQTELVSTFNLGRETEWQRAVQRGEMPIDTVKMWVTAQDELVCSVCGPLDGETAPLGEAFSDATVLVPPVHPNCRCLIFPVSEGTADVRGKEFIFPGVEVSKHLVGRHDQKNHGKKGHGRDEHTFDGNFAEAVAWAYGGLVAGMMVLPVIPNLKAINLKSLASLPKTKIADYKNAGAIKDLPQADRFKFVAAHLNDGGTITAKMASAFPEANHIKKAIRHWTTGGQKSIRNYLVTGQKGNAQYDALGMVIASSNPTTQTLHRGFRASPAMMKTYTTPGQTFHLGPTGFSSQKSVAQQFAGGLGGATGQSQAVITMRPGAKAVNIQKHANPAYKWEKEWISSGRYRVESAKQNTKGIWEIEISQVDALVPDVFSLPTYQQTVAAQSAVKQAIASKTNINPTNVDALKMTYGSKWWQQLGISDHQMGSSGILSHGFLPTTGASASSSFNPVPFLLTAKRWDEVDKKLIHVEEYTRQDGTVVEAHTRGGGEQSEPLWDLAARLLSRGEVTSRSELIGEMRKRNKEASRPLRRMKNGKITDFSTRKLGLMGEGVGFRLGNENHIKHFANKILAGEDVFRHGNRRDPILLLVYNDSAQVIDGNHRLLAAHMAGKKKVPVQVTRIHENTPEPEGFRQEWDELRRQLVRWQRQHNELPPKRPKEPFATRPPYPHERVFNNWMQTYSAVNAEERAAEHGVERGTKPKMFGKHLGGPSGDDDHPSGSSQDVHSSGGSSDKVSGALGSASEFGSEVSRSASEFIGGFDLGDGEFSSSEKMAAGTMVAAALAIASRGRIRNAISPTVWTSTVKTADGVAPSPQMMKTIRDTFEMNHGGLRATVTKVNIADAPHHSIIMGALKDTVGESKFSAASRLFVRRNNVRVQGEILTTEGRRAGTFDIAIDPKSREAFQYGMYLDSANQGSGFAGAWTGHVGMGYMKSGIRKVGALASSDVGGYAWAQRGFDWRYGPSLDVFNSVGAASKGTIPSLGSVQPSVLNDIQQMERRLKRGLTTGRFPKPKEIANIGRDQPFTNPTTGRETWAGKEIMLGTQWHASLDLKAMTKLMKSEGLL